MKLLMLLGNPLVLILSALAANTSRGGDSIPNHIDPCSRRDMTSSLIPHLHSYRPKRHHFEDSLVHTPDITHTKLATY